ncbi:MAG: hypothetical protein KF858_05515 [Candidatus Sumerlaeia bacterium]|nr:hypothetical protein [Candidatus Sumerlaeia bacterium]
MLPQRTALLLPFAAAGLAATPAVAFDTTSALARIEVAERGIVRVTRADLEGVVPDIGERDPRGLNLVYKGEVVPIHFPGEEDGAFDEGDAFYFQGTYLEGDTTTKDIYSDSSSYFLVAGHASPVRFATKSLEDFEARPTALPDGTLWHRYHLEAENLTPFFHNFGAETTDFKFTKILTSEDAQPWEYKTRLTNLSDTATTFSFHVKFYGRSSLPVNPDHEVAIDINGHPVGTVVWDGVHATEFKRTDLPAEWVAGKEATIRFNVTGQLRDARRVSPGPKDAEGLAVRALDTVFLDWFRLEYPASATAIVPGLYTYNHGKLELHSVGADAEGAWHQHRLTNIPRGDVWVLDVGNGHALRTEIQETGGDTVVATFPVFLSDATHLSVANTRSLIAPRHVVTPSRTNLVSLAAGAELVVVAHDSFLGELDGFIAHKVAMGIPSVAVATSAVYDQFNHGHKHPVAIRDFLKALHRQGDGSVRYALLIGQASQDHHGIQPEDKRHPDLLPTPWYSSRAFPQYANDLWYGMLGEDRAVHVAVGRIPATTADEVRATLAKIVEFETSGPSDWKKRALFVSSEEAMFQSELNRTAEAIAESCEDCTSHRVYAGREGASGPDYAKELRERLDEGAGLMMFAGHGGSHVWCVGPNWPPTAETNMFDIDTVNTLANKGRYPIVLAATCYTTTFAFRDRTDSMGMRLLTSPEKGAVAVLSSSARLYFHPAARLYHRMVEQIHQERPRTLGDVMLTVLADSLEADTRESQTLLGDPSLLLASIYSSASEAGAVPEE